MKSTTRGLFVSALLIGLALVVVPVSLLWPRSWLNGGASIADAFWRLGSPGRTWPTW